MDTVKDLARYLQIISGIFGAMAIFVCLIKMISAGDEAQNYIKKIKNILIALVLIYSATMIVNLVTHYFDTSQLSVGSKPSDVTIPKIAGTSTFSDKDKNGREIVVIDGIKCVVYKTNQTIYYKYSSDGSIQFSVNGYESDDSYSGYRWYKVNAKVDLIKKYSDSQGITSGFWGNIMGIRVSNTGNIPNHKEGEPYQMGTNYDEDSGSVSGIGNGTLWSENVGHLLAYQDSSGNIRYINSTKLKQDYCPYIK